VLCNLCVVILDHWMALAYESPVGHLVASALGSPAFSVVSGAVIFLRLQ